MEVVCLSVWLVYRIFLPEPICMAKKDKDLWFFVYLFVINEYVVISYLLVDCRGPLVSHRKRCSGFFFCFLMKKEDDR